MPSEMILVDQRNPHYPTKLREGREVERFPRLAARGNTDILTKPLLGFLCSVRCPGEAILRTYDAARVLRDAGVPVIGGFHSPMEKECLALLLKGSQPVIICPARSIDTMRIPALWRKPLDDGRLLVLSISHSGEKRMNAALAERRNQFVGVLARALIVPYASPAGATENVALAELERGGKVLCLSGVDNPRLLECGARMCEVGNLGKVWNDIQGEH